MRRPRARPRFTLHVPLPPDAVVGRVRAHLERSEGRVTARLFQRTMLLTVRPQDTHFWSPYLDLQLDEAEGGTRLSALFTPHPNVWTGFVGLQLLFGAFAIAAALWLTSMLMLGKEPWWALGALGVMLFGGAFSYGAAYVGQGLGSEQMYELRAFLDEALRG